MGRALLVAALLIAVLLGGAAVSGTMHHVRVSADDVTHDW